MDEYPFQTKLRLRTWLWPALAGLLLILEIIWPSRAWRTMLVILSGGWLLAYLWARSLRKGLYLQREMRYGWAQVGDLLQERFTIYNLGWAPGLWLEVEDHSTLPNYSASRVSGVGGGGDRTQWKVEQTCTRRGLYTLGPTSIHSGDPLGIYSVETLLPDSTVLMVVPPVLPLPSIQVAPGGQVGDGHRPRRSALETTVSVDTVREYSPGDPLKAIHWPTSVRRDALYVRQFEHIPSSDWWICLDLEAASQVGSGDDSTEEHGVIMAASLADYGLRQGHAVGLVTCGQDLVWIPPSHNPGQVMEILRALAPVHAGERPLSDVLISSQTAMQRGVTLVLITPNVTGEWAAPLMKLKRSEITPSVFILDPVSFGGEGNAQGIISMLDNYGIAGNLIQRELLDRPMPGQQGQWEWRVVGRGKAIPVRKPQDSIWRHLG
jgi:uncharacterized protein (DUF58 family)